MHLQKNKQVKIVQVGAGNVASHLSKALHSAGFDVVQIVANTKINAQKLSALVNASYTNSVSQITQSAQLYIISVPDSAIPSVISQLPRLNGIVVHTSGSTSIEVLRQVSDNYGVFYPFQTFSKTRLLSLRDVPVCLEASSNAVIDILSEIATSIGGKPIVMESEQRRWLHLSGVFSSNFVNHMLTLAQLVAEDKGFSFDLLKPLISETISKAFELAPANSQTGPAIRGDMDTIKKHVAMLSSINEEWMEVYRLLSSSIWNLENNKNQ